MAYKRLNLPNGTILDENHLRHFEDYLSTVCEQLEVKADIDLVHNELDLHKERIKYYGKDIEPSDSSLFTFTILDEEAKTCSVGVKVEEGIAVAIAGDVVIPYKCTIDNETYIVTALSNSAFVNAGLNDVTLPNSIINIGLRAFASCDILTSINIPDNVTYIGKGAFHSCQSLNFITIPDSVTEIGENAFLGCDNLTVLCTCNSYVEQYCWDNDLVYEYSNTLENKVIRNPMYGLFGMTNVSGDDDDRVMLEKFQTDSGDIGIINYFYNTAQINAKLDTKVNKDQIAYGTEDLEAGVSPLATGTLYFVYE